MRMKTVRHREKGFTLIELLVVVVLLGALAAIAVPNVARFVGEGGVEAAAAELQSVQTAVDVAMTDLKVAAVNAQTGVTDFSSAGAKPVTGSVAGGDAVYLYPDYIRFPQTGGDTTTYSWNTAGLVSQTGSW